MVIKKVFSIIIFHFPAVHLTSLFNLPLFLTLKIESMSSEKTDHPEVSDSRVNWLPLVLGTILVLALIIFIIKGCNGSNNG